ncbi:UNVERIFIED_CONTAM: hypothetical protein Slati_1193400 [Sesamum latifolium]|uniref:Plant thionin family protein n=1 Tax=Sesamum latifolium TaxID=2727402 RepID=A0AAW2XEE1_9LAMI
MAATKTVVSMLILCAFAIILSCNTSHAMTDCMEHCIPVCMKIKGATTTSCEPACEQYCRQVHNKIHPGWYTT